MRALTAAEEAALLLCGMPGSGKAFTAAAFHRLDRSLQAHGCTALTEAADFSDEELQQLTGNETLARSLKERLDSSAYLGQWLCGLDDIGVQPVTIYSPEYPARVLGALGNRAPVVLFCAGNLQLLNSRAVSLVGSRDLRPAGIAFAEEAGRQIAAHGYTYCSGGARGADSCGYQTAMEQGSAVLFLPGSLMEAMHAQKYTAALAEGRLLLVTEQGCDIPFTAARALSRNRLIHSFSELVLIAEARAGKGGTWNGTLENLKNHWSDLYICADDPELDGTVALTELGCIPVSREELCRLDRFSAPQISIY